MWSIPKRVSFVNEKGGQTKSHGSFHEENELRSMTEWNLNLDVYRIFFGTRLRYSLETRTKDFPEKK